MRIIFNLQRTGAGDNGGTATLFHTANVLHKLGHTVFMVSDIENQFTWFDLKGPEFILGDNKKLPDADVIVATGVKSVKSTLAANGSKGIKHWWVRAHETWSVENEGHLFAHYRNVNINKMVNSLCLQKFVQEKMDLTFPIIRPGTDIDFFKPTKIRNWKTKKLWNLGALYNEKERKRFGNVIEIFNLLKEKKVNVRLHLFGTDDLPEGIECSSYTQKPNPEELLKFYNKVDFWIAPTVSEGLHMPPQEAMLCGCVLFGADKELSGMVDYLVGGETGFVIENCQDITQLIDGLIVNKEGRELLESVSKKGREKIIDLGDRNKNVNKMIKLFESTGPDSRRDKSPDRTNLRALAARGRRV